MGVAKRREPDGAGGRKARTPYEGDFYTWTQEQAAMLRAGRVAELDLEHLAEEIEDLGKEQFSKLESAYRVILLHMLKWDHQPDKRSRSWVASIRTQQLEADDIVADNPGLKPRRLEARDRAYRKARIRAAAETKLAEARFPTQCPYSVDEIMTREFEWPER